MFNRELTIRGLVIGALGSIILTMSSMFIALKLSSLPWPIMFVVLMSMFVLKLFGNTNIQEINVTQTAMSAGAMVAGGLAFTIPGIWILNPNADVSLADLIVVTMGGVILGLIFTALFRKYFIVTKELPYAMGQAAAATLEVSDKGSKKVGLLFGEGINICTNNCIEHALLCTKDELKAQLKEQVANAKDEQIITTREALQAIHEADIIFYGIGSLYTSILPNLIVDGISEEIRRNKAKKIYFCNAMTQPGETDGFSVEDHVRAIERHSFEGAVDIVVTHSNIAHHDLLQKYQAMGSIPVHVKEEKHDYQILYRDVLSFEDALIRHDSSKIRDVIAEIIEQELK